ncbi:MAG: TonB-dependent receptor [Parabacteroides sp.]|nr:TonB-dependent receptor [Parabacteroides sp.]
MKKSIAFRYLFALLTVLCLSFDLSAQQLTVKGIVKDETGEPAIGANIIVKGTTNGTTTDLDGLFTLNAQTGDIIQVSYIGYKTQELPASASMNILLKEDSEVLDDVVVIGYGKVRKNDATGSVTALQPDKLSKGITTNAQDMLTGKVAGVSVISNDGTPGAGATIRIRGGSSLNASNDPLIVIDGLALDNKGIKGMSNGLSMVNPEDIETFTVLKDASATAIYGSRASNGVIIITTKKGKGGQAPRVSYNGSVSVATSRKRYEVLDGNEYRAYAHRLWGDNLPAPLGTADTDWQDEIYRTAVSTDHHVSVSGGLKNLPYRIALGYTADNGIIRTSYLRRTTASLSLSPSLLNDHLKINVNAKYMNGKNRYADTGAAVGGALAVNPTQPVYMDGEPYKFSGGYWQNMSPTSGFSDPAWTYTPNNNSAQNPVAALEQKSDKANSNDFVGNADVDYKVHFLPDLHVHASIGGEYAEGAQTTVLSPYSFANNYYGWNGRTSEYKYNLFYNVYAQYMKSIGAHDFDIMAGGEEQHFHRNNSEIGQGWDPVTDEPYNAKLREQTATATRNTLVSYFGRLNYSYLNRYLFTFTMRWDGSSRFDEGNRWGKFPSLALGWKINEEAFLKNTEWLSDLKLRLGWGITGQQDINDDFAYVPVYVMSNDYAQYPFGDTYYTTNRAKAFNKHLKWEKTTTYNGGVDFGMLNGRFTASLDGYYRKTDDLLNNVKIPVGTNFNAQMTKNIGSLKNYGVEFSTNAKAITTNDFLWDVSYNITWNHNEITRLNDGNDSDYYVETGDKISKGNNTKVQVNKVGYAANAFYVYQQAYDGNGKPIENTFVDRNGNGSIDEGDKYIFHQPAADILMGLTSRMTYKQWDFSFSLRASLGNYVYYDFLSNKANVSVTGLYGNNAYSNTSQAAIDLGFSGQGDYYMSDYFIRNASFVRCDNITLGYSFDRLFKTQSYRGVAGRIYGTVQNPFVITGYDGIDPEVKSGVDNNPYPRAMTFLLGVSLQF